MMFGLEYFLTALDFVRLRFCSSASGQPMSSPTLGESAVEGKVTEAIGGPQSPKQLLDDVLRAALAQDLATLRSLRDEFRSTANPRLAASNLAKCIDGNGNTLAHVAVHKDPATLQYVVDEYGADVNAQNNHGKTPLHIAVTHDFVTCAAWLLDRDAKDTTPSFTLSTPFHTAASCGSYSCMQLLLNRAKDSVARLNETDKNGSTALHKCAHDGGLRVAQWLLNQPGISINAKDAQGTTPLLMAAKMGRLEICELLIAKGADVKDVDGKYNTAVHFATSKCLPTIFTLLVDRGASMVEPNDDGNTPLHLVFLNQHPEIPGWRDMAFRIIREAKPEQIEKMKNVAGRVPKDYLARELQPDFTLEKVLEEDSRRATSAAERDAKAEQVKATRQDMINARRAAMEKHESQLREEAERLAREVEDRFQAENEARARAEEEAEARLREEEEARKKKAAKAAASAKSKK
jgi:ankyrin repeat protein